MTVTKEEISIEVPKDIRIKVWVSKFKKLREGSSNYKRLDSKRIRDELECANFNYSFTNYPWSMFGKFDIVDFINETSLTSYYIDSEISWESSPEGFYYWSELFNQYCKNPEYRR